MFSRFVSLITISLSSFHFCLFPSLHLRHAAYSLFHAYRKDIEVDLTVPIFHPVVVPDDLDHGGLGPQLDPYGYASPAALLPAIIPAPTPGPYGLDYHPYSDQNPGPY